MPWFHIHGLEKDIISKLWPAHCHDIVTYNCIILYKYRHIQNIIISWRSALKSLQSDCSEFSKAIKGKSKKRTRSWFNGLYTLLFPFRASLCMLKIEMAAKSEIALLQHLNKSWKETESCLRYSIQKEEGEPWKKKKRFRGPSQDLHTCS